MWNWYSFFFLSFLDPFSSRCVTSHLLTYLTWLCRNCSCSHQTGTASRVVSSLQHLFNGNAMESGNPNGAMDRLGQRVFFSSDFKGRDHDNVCPSMVRGIDYIRDPRLNKVRSSLKVIILKIDSLPNCRCLFYREWRSLWPSVRLWVFTVWSRHVSRPRRSRWNCA